MPVLALFAYVRVYPIACSVVLSFYKWNLISPIKPFVGWDNYIQLMSDPNFLLALQEHHDLFAGDGRVQHRCWRCRSPFSWPAAAASRPSIRRSTSCR